LSENITHLSLTATSASYRTSDSVEPLGADYKFPLDSGAHLRNSKLVRSSCEIVENSARNDREMRRNSVSKKEIVEKYKRNGKYKRNK